MTAVDSSANEGQPGSVEVTEAEELTEQAAVGPLFGDPLMLGLPTFIAGATALALVLVGVVPATATGASLPIKSFLTDACPHPPPWPGVIVNAAFVRASICFASKRTALKRVIASSSSSKMEATAKTSFSPMHSRLLSYEAPVMIARAARSRSAAL